MQKSDYRLALIESRDWWKSLDLAEKKEARTYETQQTDNEDVLDFTRQSKKARLERQH